MQRKKRRREKLNNSDINGKDINWYESQNPGLGSEFVRAVNVCLSGIGRNPLAYQVVHKQVRGTFIRKFPYIIIYLFDQDTVFVLACFHAKRDPKQWLYQFEKRMGQMGRGLALLNPYE